VVQYFERARFEHFAEFTGTPAEVQFGNLGRLSLQFQGIDFSKSPRLQAPAPECRPMASGYHLCPPFRATWEHYEAHSPLGQPLAEAFEAVHPQTGQPYLVQYFEHARLEYFPELAGTPFEVQFGLLTRELFTHVGGMP
jgi:hypothetical protein